MKRFAHSPAILAAALVVLAVFPTTSCKAPDDAQIKASLEIVDVETKWVMKEYRQWPNPKLTLVPILSFRVKNLTAEPLKFVNFNALFKEKEQIENLGDQFLSAIRDEGLAPGDLSPVITLKSNFGVEGKTLDSFKNNPMWRPYEVKLFVQMKGSRHVLLGEWPVSREIDFQEDPVVSRDETPDTDLKPEPVKK